MAPAGTPEALAAALQAGAGAVYFGVGMLNMRAGAAANFRVEDLPEVADRCHAAGAKAFLTLNVVVFDRELETVETLCAAAKAAGVDAVIASDLAVILAARRHGLSVHVSVQANICNFEAVRFHARFADLVVLARELKLNEIAAIIRRIRAEDLRGPSGEPLRVELFVHGALCSSFSGKCYLSLTAFNASANRGECLQNCRRRYLVTDPETGARLEIANGYTMSAADLCMIRFVPELLAVGADVWKIEGRGRGADYVRAVTGVYREAIEACAAGTFTAAKAAVWRERLAEVFNRGFWDGGYYLGEDFGVWSGAGGNASPLVKTMIGRVVNYYAKIGVAEIMTTGESLRRGDRLMVIGKTTGVVDFRCDSPEAHPGGLTTLRTPAPVRENDAVYMVKPRRFGSGSGGEQ